MIAAVLIAQLFAMEQIGEENKTEENQFLSKQFTGADENLYTIHFANVEEIQALNAPGRISEAGKEIHIPRVETNQVRIAIIETTQEPKQYVDFLFAGRIIYGVMPYSLTSEIPDERLAFLLDFFKNLAVHHGFADLTYTEKADKNTVWVDPVHAATVVLNGATPVINTFSFYEAMASLIRESNADLATHSVIDSVNKPFFLMVYSETEPTGDVSNKVMTIKLPIDGELNEDGSVKENKGWKWAVFARIDGEDILELPTTLTNLVDAYKISRGIEF